MSRSFWNLCFTSAIAASLIAAAPPATAQTAGESAPKKTLRETAKQKRERLDAAQREKQARIRAKQEADWRAAQTTQRKRAACSKQAKAENLHLLKRRRFMKKCMAES